MANIPESIENLGSGVHRFAWENMHNGDVGSPAGKVLAADRSVQVVGDFGVGGSVVIEGSLDGEHYATLTDPQGNPLTFTSSKIETIAELVSSVRPRVSSGDGDTELTVVILMKE